jgi:hypothetical protein
VPARPGGGQVGAQGQAGQLATNPACAAGATSRDGIRRFVARRFAAAPVPRTITPSIHVNTQEISMHASSLIVAIVMRTPVWVWMVLALLVALGLLQARTHVLPRSRVIALPVSLGLFALWGASKAFGLHPFVQGPWLLGVAAGVALNLGLQWPGQVRALGEGRFEVGGSWAPLVLMMSVFATRYVVNVSLAVVPMLATQTVFAAAASLVYGLPAGLLAARAARVLATEPRALPVAA